jgi:TPP-dependent 2-oxoacid decarboxylase
MVGSLSALNAIAGANSDDLPLLVVVGGPNSNDEARRHVVHHTIGTRDLHHGAKCYSPVVGKILRVHHVADASAMIDEALHLCGTLRKPVYLEIACNLTTQKVPLPVPVSRSFFTPRMCTDPSLPLFMRVWLPPRRWCWLLAPNYAPPPPSKILMLSPRLCSAPWR